MLAGSLRQMLPHQGDCLRGQQDASIMQPLQGRDRETAEIHRGVQDLFHGGHSLFGVAQGLRNNLEVGEECILCNS